MSKPASNSSLDWKVFVTPAIATVSDDLPPGETARMWSPLMWGKVGGPPVHAIQKRKKYRAVLRFIGSDGTEQSPIRFLLRRTSIDEPPYIVDVTCETEFGEWSNMVH
jgi:hypothetical protein